MRLDDYQEPSKRTVEYAIECVLGAEGMLARLDRPSLNKERFVHVGLVLCKIILRACELPLPGGEQVPRKGGGTEVLPTVNSALLRRCDARCATCLRGSSKWRLQRSGSFASSTVAF